MASFSKAEARESATAVDQATAAATAEVVTVQDRGKDRAVGKGRVTVAASAAAKATVAAVTVIAGNSDLSAQQVSRMTRNELVRVVRAARTPAAQWRLEYYDGDTLRLLAYQARLCCQHRTR